MNCTSYLIGSECVQCYSRYPMFHNKH